MNRRAFLIRAATGAGLAALSCGGLTALGLRAPVQPSLETLSSGESPMNQKILVTYASKAGSTAEVAQAVAEELTRRGFAVDLRPVKNVTGVDGYSAVVIGSAVRIGSWLPEAVKFVEKHQAALRQVPTAFFAVHLLNLGDDETSRAARLAYLDAARKLVQPQAEACFSGVGDFSKVSFLEGLLSKMVKSPEGDFRDWNAIRGWAQGLFA